MSLEDTKTVAESVKQIMAMSPETTDEAISLLTAYQIVTIVSGRLEKRLTDFLADKKLGTGTAAECFDLIKDSMKYRAVAEEPELKELLAYISDTLVPSLISARTELMAEEAAARQQAELAAIKAAGASTIWTGWIDWPKLEPGSSLIVVGSPTVNRLLAYQLANSFDEENPTPESLAQRPTRVLLCKEARLTTQAQRRTATGGTSVAFGSLYWGGPQLFVSRPALKQKFDKCKQYCRHKSANLLIIEDLPGVNEPGGLGRCANMLYQLQAAQAEEGKPLTVVAFVSLPADGSVSIQRVVQDTVPYWQIMQAAVDHTQPPSWKVTATVESPKAEASLLLLTPSCTGQISFDEPPVLCADY